MPLKKGAGRGTVSSNIEILVHDHESKGTIGNSRPANKTQAVKQAVAIALDKARASGGNGKAATAATKVKARKVKQRVGERPAPHQLRTSHRQALREDAS